MLRKPSARHPDTLIAAFLLLSFASSIAILAVRNLYDDEILSLPIVTNNTRYILHFSSSGDVHPPGMYLLAHFSWLVLPSYRWMNLAPTVVLYAGIAIFVHSVTPLFCGTPGRLCFLLLATLHPQLLLWGTSFRWYSWWTGLALICIAVALQPRQNLATFSTARAIAVALLLASLFYLNYITILFAIALAAAIIVRYSSQLRSSLLRYAMAVAICGAFVAPQLHVLATVHLQRARAQSAGLIGSFVRLVQGLGGSEAYLPWHPLAIISTVFIVCCCFGFLRAHSQGQDMNGKTALVSLAVLGAVFFALIVFSGLGGKPRSALLLVPLLATIVGWKMERSSQRYMVAVLVLLALWSGTGIVHMLGRYGLSKAEMIDRPEDVVRFVRERSAGNCAIVATYDPTLSFALSQANLPGTVLIAPFSWPVGQKQPAADPTCPHQSFYAVKSYLGYVPRWQVILNSELDDAVRNAQNDSQTHEFSRDPDAATKRKLAGLPGFGNLKSAADLPDYRYVVVSGPIEPASVGSVQHALKDFTVTGE